MATCRLDLRVTHPIAPSMLSSLANHHVPHSTKPLQHKAQIWALRRPLCLSMTWEVTIKTNTLYIYPDDSE